RSSSVTATSRTAPSAVPRTFAASFRPLRPTARLRNRASARPPAGVAAAALAAAATEFRIHPPAVLDSRPMLDALREEASVCTRCRLAESRTQVVFGVGSPTADLMFVGEAPGFHEDQQGVPFVGQAGKLLDT